MNEPPNPTIPPPDTFESSLQDLERAVEQLEAGSLPLEESLALFEKGVGALKRCHTLLDSAEKRVRVLVKGARGELQCQDQPATPVTAPSPAKKSPRPPVDSPAQTGHNAAPLDTIEKESTEDDIGPGGSLFGG